MHTILGKSGPFILLILSLIPLVWWLPDASLNLLSFARIFGIIGSVLLALNFLLSARVRWFEYFFSGLNRMYIVHALVGSVSFLFLIIHPLFLLLSRYQLSLESALSLITPSLDNVPVLLGSLAFGLMAILMIFSIYIKIAYHNWKSLHQWFGLVLLLASIHAMLSGSTIAANPGLKIYLFTIYTLGILAFVYKKLSRFFGANHYYYQVDKVNVEADIITITLSTLTKRLDFIAGQFAFLGFFQKALRANPTHFL